MTRRKMRHLLAEDHSAASTVPARQETARPVTAGPLPLHRTIGNAAMQRLLATADVRPNTLQRGFLDDIFDTVSDAVGGVTDALSSIPKIVTDSPWAPQGEELTVTDADARLRTDPPGLKNTGAIFSKGRKVRVLGSTTKEKLRYVHIEEVMEPDMYGPPFSGWTRRSNLDLSSPGSSIGTEQVKTKVPTATGPEDIPGLPAKPPIDHPFFTLIVADLQTMENTPVPIETIHKEEHGEAREQRVKDIARVRANIAKLTPDLLGVPEPVFQAGVAYLNRRLRPLAPYSNQNANTNILGTSTKAGWERTCNVTVPAMLVEGLGRSKDAYDGRFGDVAFLQQIFEALEGKYLARDQYESAGDFEALRMPDFMALVGIARKMPKDAAGLSPKKFDEAVGRARDNAAKATTAHATMVDLLEAFGTTVAKNGVHAAALGTIGEARRDYTRVLLGANYKDREKKKAKYDALDADALLSVSKYRASVLKAVNPLLDSGAQILVGMENHFVRLDAMDEDSVQIDDPGYGTLKNARLTWQQSRDFGMFKGFWSVTA